MDAVTNMDVLIIQLPMLIASGGIYYKQGKLDARMAALEKLITLHASFKRK